VLPVLRRSRPSWHLHRHAAPQQTRWPLEVLTVHLYAG
jgi:hypothetical protein